MDIKFLKAGCGDSILIQQNSKNIIIDGGNDSTTLISEVEKIIKLDQIIDLLIVTHHDDDHIKGIIDLIRHIESRSGIKSSNFFKEVLFNSPNKILHKQNKDNYLSYKQAFELEELLLKNDINWNGCNENTKTIVIGELEFEFLSQQKMI